MAAELWKKALKVIVCVLGILCAERLLPKVSSSFNFLGFLHHPVPAVSLSEWQSTSKSIPEGVSHILYASSVPLQSL